MRWLFVLLLGLNVVYFGWELDRETTLHHRQIAATPPIPASAQQLQLLTELPQAPAVRTLEPAVTDVADAPVAAPLSEQAGLVTDLPDITLPGTDTIPATYTCYRYGPLLDEDQMASLQQWFVDRNIQAESSFIEEQGRQLFWIYLAPQPSLENAMAVLQEMQNKGIGDFRLINRGDLQNAISLGLFSSREAVNSRLDELKEKGYVPVVVPYANVRRIYSLNVRAVDSGSLLAEIEQGYPARFESDEIECAQDPAAEYSPAPVL